jgi:hypothetical protein
MQKKKATPKIMKLIDPSTGLMECKVCGAQHFAMIRPHSNGYYYRGSWQCVNGCSITTDKGQLSNHKARLLFLLGIARDIVAGKGHEVKTIPLLRQAGPYIKHEGTN